MSSSPHKITRFWREIKRRNVHRSLAIYAGSAFVFLEAADLIAPRLGFPDWTIDLVLYLLILGAVITLVVAWIYDITPTGVERTKAFDEKLEEKKGAVSQGWRIATFVSLVVIAGLILFNLTGGFRQLQAGSIKSLVVLPFDNFTGDEELAYFVSGMHASLIGDMGKINGLRVISKTSSNSYRGIEKSVPEIASELKVDAVVETNVMCLGDSVCVQFKLITAFPEEQLLWSRTYNSDMSNILNLYNWVIRDIADEIRLPLSPEQQNILDQPRHIDPDAYELYLKGTFHMGFLNQENQQAALEYFNKAIEIDRGYAAAYAGISGVWAFLKQMDYVSPDVATPKMEEFMSKALQLDRQSAEIYYYDGIKKVWTDFDWEGGESSFKRCIEINPNFSEARAYYSHLMMLLKRPGEMKEQMRMALETDPKNPLIQVLAAVELMVESNYDLCIETAVQLQKMMPNNPLLMLVLFQCYTEKGDHDLALIELRKVFHQIAGETVIQTLDRVYATEGFEKALTAAADVWVELPTFASAQNAIMLYAYGGNTDKALYWLEKSYIRRDPANPYIGVVPYLRPCHDESRYIEIMQRMKLPLGEFAAATAPGP